MLYSWGNGGPNRRDRLHGYVICPFPQGCTLGMPRTRFMLCCRRLEILNNFLTRVRHAFIYHLTFQIMLPVLCTWEGTCLRFTVGHGDRSPRLPGQTLPCLSPFPFLWPPAPLSFLMASPCLGLSGMRQANYNQTQGVRVATGRRLTYEVSVPSYHIYGAVPSAVGWLGADHYPEASGKVLDHISPQAWGPHCSGP